MTDNPYRITGPALISFSGGRTSAYMLWHILDAHGGVLPQNTVVTFANTGREREETLRFVHDCSTHWGVKVRWLEYRSGPTKFEEVGFNSASRNGEPFSAIIAKKQYLPNSFTRFCTQELKIRVMRDFCKREMGWKNWLSVIGLRYDEGIRVMRAIERNEAGKDPWRAVMPMSKAKATKRDVMDFWACQPFDLKLKSYEGNCDLCFLKGKQKLKAIIRENPGIENWWIEEERKEGKTLSGKQGYFLRGYRSYADLAAEVRSQTDLFIESDDEEFDVECGLTCDGGEEES